MHLATNHQAPLTLRYIRQRVVRVHLAPILQRTAVIQVGAPDRTVRVRGIRIAPAAVPAVEVPVRVGTEEGFVAARDHLGEGGSVVGGAGAPDLDNGGEREGHVEVEEVLLPDDRGEGVGV